MNDFENNKDRNNKVSNIADLQMIEKYRNNAIYQLIFDMTQSNKNLRPDIRCLTKEWDTNKNNQEEDEKIDFDKKVIINGDDLSKADKLDTM